MAAGSGSSEGNPTLPFEIGVATLYRHFATKEELLDGFFAWQDTQGVGGDAPATVDELVASLPRLYDWFDRSEATIRAGLMTGTGREFRRRQRDRRWAGQWQAVAELTQELDDDQALRARAAVRLLVNSQAWLTLREEEGLTGEQAGEIAAWMLELVLTEVQR